MKPVLLVVVSIVIGFFSHKYFFSEPAQVQDPSYEQKYNDLKAKFEQIGEVDFEEYLELKSEKEKYNKANEIFEKILKIFLLDLGLRTSQRQLDKLKAPLPSADQPKTVSVGIPDKTQFFPPSSPKPQNNQMGWSKSALRASEVSFDSEVKEFLESVTAKNFEPDIKSAENLTAELFQLFRGRFDGEAIFDDHTKPTWQVVMQINGRRDGETIKGRTLISLSKDGKVFSKGSNGGDILTGDRSVFKSFPGVKNAILVNANGGDAYFQLFYFERLKQFAGVVYSKAKNEGFVRTGVVTLQRVN